MYCIIVMPYESGFVFKIWVYFYSKGCTCSKMRDFFFTDLAYLPCLRISTKSWCSCMQTKTTKATNLSALSMRQPIAYFTQNHLHRLRTTVAIYARFK